MTVEQFRAQWKALKDQMRTKKQEATAWCDQQAAIFFRTSGLTQQQIALEVERTQQWVAYRLRFGAFLSFTTTVVKLNIPPLLTEWRFRGYWEQTSGSRDIDRFKQVVELMLAEFGVQIRDADFLGQIIRLCSDWQWRSKSDVMEMVEFDGSEKDKSCGVSIALNEIKDKAAKLNLRMEVKKKSRVDRAIRAFRLKRLPVKANKDMRAAELADELLPVVEKALATVRDHHALAEFSRKNTESYLNQILALCKYILGKGPKPTIDAMEAKT